MHFYKYIKINEVVWIRYLTSAIKLLAITAVTVLVS